MSKAYTPATIGDKLFSIPLYQRLFEWEEKQVCQLLHDSKRAFDEDDQKPYYIGVLTVFKDKSIRRYSLVDGQQRFTILMLLGIVLEWNEFLESGNELRLTFFARPNDEMYLRCKIRMDESKDYTNAKMDTAIQVINSFLNSIVSQGERERFKIYLKNKATFFVSELPERYSPIELNRYFEAMNEAGKGLENHDILKVTLLKTKEIDKDRCTQIWNLVSQMDSCLILQKGEDNAAYKKKSFAYIKEPDSILKNESLNDGFNECNIKSIKASSIKPLNKERNHDARSVIDFQEFLLLVLALTTGNQGQSFEKSNLLAIFQKEDLTTEIVQPFFENLLRYRLLFDYFIIRINSLDGRTANYTLEYSCDGEDFKSRALIQYQSMLYVSTSYNIWMVPLLKDLLEFVNGTKPSFDILDYLKTWDENRLKNQEIKLVYGSINRYWFWRLDYYLWERHDKLFKNRQSKIIADRYVFRPNRSIEHICPQKPKSLSNFQAEKLLDLFGNLAMISSGQNSSLQNESYEIKMAHVSSFSESRGGSIESLKLLVISEAGKWNKGELIKHHNEMIDILIASFSDASIIAELQRSKISEVHAQQN